MRDCSGEAFTAFAFRLRASKTPRQCLCLMRIIDRRKLAACGGSLEPDADERPYVRARNPGGGACADCATACAALTFRVCRARVHVDARGHRDPESDSSLHLHEAASALHARRSAARDVPLQALPLFELLED